MLHKKPLPHAKCIVVMAIGIPITNGGLFLLIAYLMAPAIKITR